MTEQVDLQRLADIVSEQSAQLAAQRFLIQGVWKVLKDKGLLAFEYGDDVLLSVARLAYGTDGHSPNRRVLEIIEEMIGDKPTSAQILEFPKS